MQIPKLNSTTGQPQVVWEHEVHWPKWPSSYWWWFQQCHRLSHLNTGDENGHSQVPGRTPYRACASCSLSFWLFLNTKQYSVVQTSLIKARVSKETVQEYLFWKVNSFIYESTTVPIQLLFVNINTGIKSSGKANSNDSRYSAANPGCQR